MIYSLFLSRNGTYQHAFFFQETANTIKSIMSKIQIPESAIPGKLLIPIWDKRDQVF